jgi:hypothetical protein
MVTVMGYETIIDIGKPDPEEPVFSGNMKILKFPDGSFHFMVMQLLENGERDVTIVAFTNQETKEILNKLTAAI